MSACLHGAACLHCRLDRLTQPATTNHLAGELLTWDDAAGRLGVSPEHLTKLVRDAGLERHVVTGIGRGRKLRARTLDELIAHYTQAGATT